MILIVAVSAIAYLGMYFPRLVPVVSTATCIVGAGIQFTGAL